MLPSRNLIYITVFNGIEMNVIKMITEIRLVPDAVFPVPVLPQLAARITTFHPGQPTESSFYGSPSSWKIVIIFRQRPETMHMVRKNDPSLCQEWPLLFGFQNGPSQDMEMINEQRTFSVLEIDGKKIGSSRNKNSFI